MEEETKVCTGETGREWYEWIQILVWTVLVIVGLFTVFCRVLGVDGHSMVRARQRGELLRVANPGWTGEYRQGDVVIAGRPDFNDGLPVVKRVIATAGQTVDIDFLSGSVFVDGRLLEEPYIAEPTYLDEGMKFPLTLISFPGISLDSGEREFSRIGAVC